MIVCRGSCFLSYTAESSHHLMAALTPKDAPCQEENVTLKALARSHVKRREKLYFLVFGESRDWGRGGEGNPPLFK
jgi:hypothetical protein